MLDPMAATASPRLLTARDMLARPDLYKHNCELWDGVLQVRDASGGEGELVACRIVEQLARYVRERRLGWVTLSSHGYLVARNPDRVLSPDTAYTSKLRLPDHPKRGFTPMAPDFAVEVISPSDTREAQVAKAGVWLAHGSRVVWVVDPDAREVIVLRPLAPPEVVGRGGVVNAAPALPRFRLWVARLFDSY